MHIGRLLSVLVACSAAYGCATPPEEPAAAQTRSEPVIRTGTRLPGNNSGATGQIGRDDWMNDKARQGSTSEIMK